PHLFDGRVDGRHARGFPFEITPAILQRGRERYQIFCMPCHDSRGSGNGIIVQLGFKQPTSFHDRFLIRAPEGRIYLAIKNGVGMMDGFAARIPVEDRWAIVAYVRALQGDPSPSVLIPAPPSLAGGGVERLPPAALDPPRVSRVDANPR
ncbi:cytochrome c, partial [Arthrospira platensis SPKY1]|nr:cytochrome c [Arthrospira platensis SPKY1]